MSAGEEYVIRISWPGSEGAEASRLFDVSYASEEAARAALAVLSFDEDQTITVHKLGPAIPAPEPREWVVVGSSGYVSAETTTRGEAERKAAALYDGCRVARLVFEDAP